MDIIDLHGVRHDDVHWLLIKKIEFLWNTDTELHIITGHSEKMKKIVTDILDEYKLDYKIGDFFGINVGFMKTLV